MSTKRSYLDNLNAGRQRRSGTPVEDINRTLDQLERRLEQTQDVRARKPEQESDITQRMQRLSQAAATPHAASPPTEDGREGDDRLSPSSLERIAREIEDSCRQEDQLAAIGGIANELKALREDMRAMVGSSLQREFNVLREELARIMAAVPQSPLTAEVNADFEQLSRAIALLAERSDDKSTKLLRLELEQVKASLAKLAREDSVRALDRRWDAMETRLSSGPEHASDPAVEGLSARLAEIEAAVNSLPESLSLGSLEERLRALASSLDQFADYHDQSQPDLHAMIEERLDEISRAIAASAALARSSNFDARLLERIEARISSLANQINELAEDGPDGMIVDRLNALSNRVDDVARRIDGPELAVERLAGHIAQVSQKLDTVPHGDGGDHLLRSLEDRFAQLSGLMERRLWQMAERLDRPAEGEAALLAAMDSRFAELAARIEAARQETGEGALRALETRLEDISDRLQTSASIPGIDPEVIRNLESQVASLSTHLARPGREVPEFEDLAPRLEKIERSISENRAAVVDAARQAAEEAIRTIGAARLEPDDRLKEDLKTLAALTRKSDERNAKTFEAIHDTLLKIVERLGSLEEGAAGRVAMDRMPPMDPASSYEDAQPRHAEPRRNPAEAAVAAAEAALLEEEGGARQEEKRSMLGELSRALAGGRGHAAQSARGEPVLDEELDDASEPVLDEARINEPLEPGSGAPDLNAVMRRVRDEHGTRESGSRVTAKADFVAAARRAAQAAAAEAETLKNSRSDAASNGGKSGLGKILSRRKKHLLLALGTAIVIAGGLLYGRTMLWDGGAPARTARLAEPADEKQAATTPKPTAQARSPEPVRTVDAGDAEKVDAGTTAAVNAPPARPLTAQHDGQVANTAFLPANVPAVQQKQEVAREEAASHAAASGEAAVDETQADEAALDDALADRTVLEEARLEPEAPDLPEVPAEAGPAALREAAAQGKAAALYEIANRYASGEGVKADMAAAARWYEEAAELGLAPAQYRIANLYEKGKGVERDIAKAKMWYRRAAVQGNASAMHNLGVLYAMGADGTADNETAARWFQEAADLGVVDSQFNLGILSAKGAGVKRDLSEAYKWFDIVARTGDQDAAAKRDEIARAMAPAELAKAQGKARLWESREMDPHANTVEIPRQWRTDNTVTGGVDMKMAIRNIQAILNGSGFDAGPLDGMMGDKTRQAIKAFQKSNGMAVTGEIDDALARALLARSEAAR